MQQNRQLMDLKSAYDKEYILQSGGVTVLRGQIDRVTQQMQDTVSLLTQLKHQRQVM